MTPKPKLPTPYLILILLFALLIRLPLANSDFWLDEIWSFELANLAGDPLSVFGIKHDNNHLLNTAWLSLTGPQAHPLLARALSLIAGLCLVYAAALFGQTVSPRTAAFFALWTASSPALITLSTQARGYAPMLAAAAWAISGLHLALQSANLQDQTPFNSAAQRWRLGALLAALFQLTVVPLILSALILATILLQKKSLNSTQWRQITLLPFITLSLLYFYFVRLLDHGGGPNPGFFQSILGAATWLLANNPNPPLTFFSIPLAAIALNETIRKPIKSSDWLIPILLFIQLITAAAGTVFYPRYFTIYALALLAIPARNIAIKSPKHPILTTLIITLALSLNLYALPKLLSRGHATFPQVLQSIEQQSPDSTSIGSDNPDWAKLLLNFWQQRGRSTKIQLDNNSIPEFWLIPQYNKTPESTISRNNTTYSRIQTFTPAPDRGYPIHLYKKSKK